MEQHLVLSERTFFILASCREWLQSHYLQKGTCEPELIVVKHEAFCTDAGICMEFRLLA